MNHINQLLDVFVLNPWAPHGGVQPCLGAGALQNCIARDVERQQSTKPRLRESGTHQLFPTTDSDTVTGTTGFDQPGNVTQGSLDVRH